MGGTRSERFPLCPKTRTAQKAEKGREKPRKAEKTRPGPKATKSEPKKKAKKKKKKKVSKEKPQGTNKHFEKNDSRAVSEKRLKKNEKKREKVWDSVKRGS